MPFVSFSAQNVIENSTIVSNIFCDEHLPTMNGDVVRIYLYGLYLCSASERDDNNLEHMATMLKLQKDDIIGAYQHMQDLGLVKIIDTRPLEIKYMPVRAGMSKIKKFATDKYADFNAQIQVIISGRMITPTEFSEYYAFLETFHVEQTALIMVAKYCTDLKGANVGYRYILTVAKNWATEGAKTVSAVEDKLLSCAFDKNAVSTILKRLKIKRLPEADDYALIEKWRRAGFALPTIEIIANYLTKTNRRSFDEIDIEISRFIENNTTSPDAIEKYIESQTSFDKKIKTLLTSLGLTREVSQFDRDFYSTWTNVWHFTPEIINYGASQSVGKGSPMTYLNKILSTYFDNHVTTLQGAKATSVSAPTVNITRHSYAEGELNKRTKDISEVKF